MPTTLLRLLVAAWVLVMLSRAAHGAWQHRRLARTIWSRIGARHLLGALGLLLAVLTVSLGLLSLVPVTRIGLGSLIDFTGNAVFAPLEAAARSSPAGAGEPDWLLAVLTTAFLAVLGLLLPWLAFVEEEVFRAGLEHASLARQGLVALVFGAAHLVMLVPVAAALAIAAVGFVYGRIYRRAYARTGGRPLPAPVAAAFRQTKRSARAAERSRATARTTPGTTLVVDRTPERRQAAAVLASTVWHTAFNTLVVVLVWVTLTATALLGPPA